MNFSRLFVTRCIFSSILFGLLTSGQAGAQSPPSFSQVVVFGDSLSDVDNLRDQMESDYFISYPGGDFNYSDGRFTNSSDTDPASHQYVGVWAEQLARTFLGLSPATASLDGGLDYAFAGGTTKDGTSDRTVFSNPDPFIGGSTSVTVDNMGRQLDRYLNQHTVDPAALYLLWGGANDLYDDSSANNVTATSMRVIGLINRLVTAGARNFLVPNVPPLGDTPKYSSNASKQLALNTAALSYRFQLNADLDAAQAAFVQQGITVNIYRVDVWSLFVRFAINPGAYGFTDVTHSAQGESVDPDTYAFWDDIHPTTAGHFQIAQEAARVLSGQVGTPAHAANISGRVDAGQGDHNAIGGFIITGNAPKNVVLRGLGPSLAASGVNGVLADPNLKLFDAAGNVLQTNDNWADTQEAEIMATGLAPTNRLESAMKVSLAPGAYTVLLGSTNPSPGNGLIEIYDIDPAADATFANVSTRGFVGINDDVLIGGLIVDSGDPAIFVLRAIGPSLSTHGIQNFLADPVLALFDANGNRIATNDDWQSGQPLALKATLLAPTDDHESALAVSLMPGNYTAVVRGKGNTTGTALIEAYRVP